MLYAISVTYAHQRHRNIALKKHAVQVSTIGEYNLTYTAYNLLVCKGQQNASLAMDGDGLTCSKTKRQKNPSFTIDLGDNYIITGVRINSGKCLFC